jgi:hypothetical protein
VRVGAAEIAQLDGSGHVLGSGARSRAMRLRVERALQMEDQPPGRRGRVELLLEDHHPGVALASL